MASRGQGLSKDWNPMRDDYNDSIYDTQYADDNNESGVQLEHNRLYVCNIPQTLSEEGLRMAFAKYGTIVKIFLTRDPKKRYALITYEAASEAKLAMMKLNRSEPLKLNISISHKTKRQDADVERNPRNQTWNRTYKDESSSVSSKGNYSRKQEVLSENDDVSITEGLDPDIHLELEQLKLEHLKLKDEQVQCRQRILLLNRAGKKNTSLTSNRIVTADGKVVIKTTSERSMDLPADTTFSGAGDSFNIPALQRVADRKCLHCGEQAELFCGGCGIAPYCGAGCQRTDWLKRHRTVCHNLARTCDGAVLPEANNNNTEDMNGSTVSYKKHPLRAPRPRCDDDTSANNDSSGQELDNRTDRKKPSSRGRNFAPKPSNMRRPRLEQNGYSDNIQDKKSSERVHEKRQMNTSEKKLIEQNGSTSSNNQDSKTVAPKLEVRSTIRPTTDLSKEKETKMEKGPVSTEKPSPSVPSIKILPKKYLIETLSVGETVVLSVDARAQACGSRQEGCVCVALHRSVETQYQMLCEEYCALCEADTEVFVPKPGELFSYRDPEDQGWYRARKLSATAAALLDCSRTVTMTAADVCRRVPPQYTAIPEFCCVLNGGGMELGESYQATIEAVEVDSVRVKLQNLTGTDAGHATLTRWTPDIQLLDVEAPVPEILRPSVLNNSRVILVHATTLDCMFVRLADVDTTNRYNAILQEVLLYGLNAKCLSQPPSKGQLVIGKFTDGNHYRALVKRTSVKNNKYMLEYVEFGNVQISPLEDLYPCPNEMNLEVHPALVSMVKVKSESVTLTEEATAYIDKLKDEEIELVLTLPSNAKSAPSGCEVQLEIEKNRERVNKRLVDLCTAEWKKMEETGADVVDVKPIMFSELETAPLVAGGGRLVVLDASSLPAGVLAVCRDTPLRHRVLHALAAQIEEYCNSALGREPYLPKPEELCIARCGISGQWSRAVLVKQEAGAGGGTAHVCFLDRGPIRAVPVTSLRKMLPDFARLPALAALLQLRGFPNDPTQLMLRRAEKFLKMDEEGFGEIFIQNCTQTEPALYEADAPELLAAMGH